MAKTLNTVRMVIVILFIGISSCEYNYFPVPPSPKVPKETAALEASFLAVSLSGTNDTYWKEADYLSVKIQNISTGNLYNDGLLNMTGNFTGLSGFNGGTEPSVTMKACYNDDKVFLLIEWTDSDINPSFASWLWNGADDPLKTDSSAGWTSQRNHDKAALAFEINTVSGSQGLFANVGCAASCHNNKMKPLFGTVDIWNWTLAYSDPLGYAADMFAGSDSGLMFDSGTKMQERNIAGTSDRSGPAYEWDGNPQTITKGNGKTATLDAAFYLLSQNKTSFTGDPAAGKAGYNDTLKGCIGCHGENGAGGGEHGDGRAFNDPGIMNRWSRQSFIEKASLDNHDGSTYFNQLNTAEKNNIIAYIRGLTGVPGYYLNYPAGSNADIIAASNVTTVEMTASHTTYKVMFERKLITNNSDDIQFDLSKSMSYPFGIALMDNDGKNHIGSMLETLTFLQKK